MKTFEECVSELYRQPYGEAAWLANVQWALEALADERAAKQVQPGLGKNYDPARLMEMIPAPMNGRREPRSCSHWGMHA